MEMADLDVGVITTRNLFDTSRGSDQGLLDKGTKYLGGLWLR